MAGGQFNSLGNFCQKAQGRRFILSGSFEVAGTKLSKVTVLKTGSESEIKESLYQFIYRSFLTCQTPLSQDNAIPVSDALYQASGTYKFEKKWFWSLRSIRKIIVEIPPLKVKIITSRKKSAELELKNIILIFQPASDDDAVSVNQFK